MTESTDRREQALSVLDRLISEATTQRSPRGLICLTDFAGADVPMVLGGYDPAFAFVVPQFLAESLDIRSGERRIDSVLQEVTTQGASFHFEANTILYDHRSAYDAPFGSALSELGHCVQVLHSEPAGRDGNARSAGSVTFQVFTPNESRTALVPTAVHTTTQDQFVRFLIAGLP